MALAIVVIGYLHQYYGLTSAMLAHTMIDIVLFVKLTTEYPNTTMSVEKEQLPEHRQSSFQSAD